MARGVPWVDAEFHGWTLHASAAVDLALSP